VDVERRPCFLPLTSVDQTTTQEIANFFGFKESGSANSGSGSGDGSSCGSASTENVNMKENEHDTVLSSSSTSSSPSSVLPSLAVGSYHKDRSMIYTCSHGAFALQVLLRVVFATLSPLNINTVAFKYLLFFCGDYAEFHFNIFLFILYHVINFVLVLVRSSSSLQAHASLHVASFGEPFVNRMSSEAAHWYKIMTKVQDERNEAILLVISLFLHAICNI